MHRVYLWLDMQYKSQAVSCESCRVSLYAGITDRGPSDEVRGPQAARSPQEPQKSSLHRGTATASLTFWSFLNEKYYSAVSCFLLHLQYLILFLVGAISSPLLSLCSSDLSHREQPVLIHNWKTASAVLKTAQGKRSIRGNMTASGFCERFGFVVRFLLQSRVFSCQRCITSRSIFCQSGLQEIIIHIQTAYVAALYTLISNSMYAALLLSDFSNYNHKFQCILIGFCVLYQNNIVPKGGPVM